MNKILITIYVLSLDEEYDVFLPINKKVSDILDIIQDSLIDLSNSNYEKKSEILLYMSDGNIVNPNNIVKYSGLTNGCKVCIM